MKYLDGIHKIQNIFNKPQNKRRLTWGTILLVILGLLTSLIFISSNPKKSSASPGTKTKTVEFYVGQSTASGGVALNTFWTSNFNVYLPDCISSSTAIKSAYIDFTFSMAATTAPGVVTQQLKLSTNPTYDTVASVSYATSSEGYSIRHRANFLSTLQGAIQTPGTYTFNYGARVQSILTKSHSARIAITYDYDDAATTQIKTVRYYGGQRTTDLPLSTTQAFSLSAPVLPENSISIYDAWAEVTAVIVAGGATDETVQLWYDSDAATSVYQSDIGGAAIRPAYFLLRKVITDAAHTFSVRPTVGYALSAVGMEQFITYSFNYTNSDSLLTTYEFLMGSDGTRGSSTTLNWNKTINIPESSLIWKSIYLKGTAHSVVTNGNRIAAQLNSTPTPATTYGYTYGSECYGNFWVLSNETNNLNTMSTGNNAIYTSWVMSTGTATSRSLSVILTYAHAKSDTTYNASAKFFIGQDTVYGTIYTPSFNVSISGSTQNITSYLYANSVNSVVNDKQAEISIQPTSISAYPWNSTGEYQWIIFAHDNTASEITGTGTYTANLNSDANNVMSGFTVVNWQYAPPSITISGNIYATGSESVTDNASFTIAISVNNVAPTTFAASGGSYTKSGITASSGNSIAVYIQGDAKDANTFTVTDGTTSITNLHLYVDKVAVGNNNGTGTTQNSNICTQIANPGAGDKLISCSGNNLTINSGKEFHILNGRKYDTGSTATLTTQGAGGDLHLDTSSQATFSSAGTISGSVTNGTSAALTIGTTNALNVGGNWTNAGTFTANSSTVTFNGSGAQTIGGSATTTFNNVATAGTTNTSTGIATNIGGTLSIGNSTTFTAAGFDLTVTGTTTVGGGTSGSLVVSSATGAKTFIGLLTVAAGGTWNNSGNSAVFFRGGITNNATFTAGSGVHTFNTNAQALSGTFSIPSITVTGVTLTNNNTLTVTTALAGTGGLTNAATGTLNINFTGVPGIATLTATASGNTVNYGLAGTQTVFATNYHHLTLSNTSAKTLQTGTTAITGDLTLSGTASTTGVVGLTIGGTVTIGSGTSFTAGSYTHNVAGNWSNSGIFTANSGTVTFNGADSSIQTLSGNTTFYNFTASTASNAAGRTIKFTDGSTTTVTGTWTITGFAGKVITLTRTVTTSAWTINPTAASVTYVNVSWSTNAGVSFCATYSTDGLNNTGWSITGGASCNTAPNSPTALVQKKTDDTVIAQAGWTNQTSVKYTATASDTDNPDTLYLCVEKDPIGTVFSGTEDACGTGVAYSGTPVTVTLTIASQTDNTEYHWQARIKDAASAYSSWVSYGTNTDPNDRDYGIDTTAPTGGTVYDGTSGDQDWNDGSLTSLSSNWTGFDATVSGLNKYEYAIRRSSDSWYWNTTGPTWQSGAVWYDNGAGTTVTMTPIYLNTGENYYFSVRATDNATNTASPQNSNGQQVSPTLSFSLSGNTVTFADLNNANNWTDTKTSTTTTSTNASSGYTAKAYITQLLTSLAYPSVTIANFYGTWANPEPWPLGTYGFGYTSNDANVQGSNRFAGGTQYAPFSQTASGDVVADHTDYINGQTGAVSNEQFIITYKVAVSNIQAASTYQTYVTYIVTANY